MMGSDPMTATTSVWNAATSIPPLAPAREEDMIAPAMAECSKWWQGRHDPDFVAREIVGPLAIADLVGVQFDHGALRRRQEAEIPAIDDLLVLRVLLACRRSGHTVTKLATLLGFSESGIRRAVRDAYEVGALVGGAGRRHRTHQAWRPAGRRLVAVELKLTDWQRAAKQAWAYQAWASASWVILGHRLPLNAIEGLASTGIGLGYLDEDKRFRPVLRPTARRRATGEGAVWAAEQALMHAHSSGADPLVPIKQAHATSPAAMAVIAG
jgi:hypothetical protein